MHSRGIWKVEVKATFLLLGLFLIANQVVGNLLLAEVLGTPVCSH